MQYLEFIIPVKLYHRKPDIIRVHVNAQYSVALQLLEPCIVYQAVVVRKPYILIG